MFILALCYFYDDSVFQLLMWQQLVPETGISFDEETLNRIYVYGGVIFVFLGIYWLIIEKWMLTAPLLTTGTMVMMYYSSIYCVDDVLYVAYGAVMRPYVSDVTSALT